MASATSKAIMNETLSLIGGGLKRLVGAIEDPGVNTTGPEVVDLCNLVVSLFSGICRSPFVGIVDEAVSDNKEAFVLTQVITPSLRKLAALMAVFGPIDTRIKTGLITCFTSYAEIYISFLNPSESYELYNAASELIKRYASIGGGSGGGGREEDAEEEQQYEDIMQAIKLLSHLGTKDFIDCVDSRETGAGGGHGAGIDVTDVIFYGISHILPLVSGLLEYPKLSNQFFDLVGYIVETYPEKLNGLPPDFFEGLIGSLLWGISNVDAVVGKNCLKAIEEMTKDHVRNNSMTDILAKKPGVLKACVDKLLAEVVMVPTVVFDRIDNAGGTLMVLIAVDLAYFTGRVREMIAGMANGVGAEGSEHVGEQQRQLMTAFEQLMCLETIQAGLTGKGLTGRNARSVFKKNFESFVKHVHSFLTCA